MTKEIQKAKNQSIKAENDLTWSSVGPAGVIFDPEEWGIVSGRVKAIAVHPYDPQIVYIGAACGGIWKTMDGGQTWMDVGHDLESVAFGAIAIDPGNPETVYAGSGECLLLDDFYTFSGRGLFKSTDGGSSWIVITDGFGSQTHFSDLVVHPNNSNVVFATIGGGTVFSGATLPNEGIWKSLDGGITWNKTLDVPDVSDIAFHPNNPDMLYASAGGYISQMMGFYISTDQGETWVQSNSGLNLPALGGRMQFDISLSDPSIIYAVIFEMSWTVDGPTCAYKSLNGGNSWTQISVGTQLGGNYGGGWMDQGWYDLCIAVDPDNPDHVLIGNVELHRTTDGSSYAPVRPYDNSAYGSLCHVDYHKLVFAPSNHNILYIGCDGGIYKSTDKGYTATSQNLGLETMQFYRIASHPTNPQVIIGGMQDNSTARTTDGGQTWEVITGGDGMECLFNPNPDTIYTASQNGYFHRSINGGASFNYMYNANGAWITPLLMHPTNHKILYTANKRIWKSVNGGTSFQLISGTANLVNSFINTMAQSRVNPSNMIFGSGIGHPYFDTVHVVKISTDEGVTWSDVSQNIPGEERWISRVVCDPVDANTMYILRTGFSAGNKVWKTTDLGQTWTNLSADLPDLPCSDLFIDPENTQHLYLANDIGIYHSGNGGINWEYASAGVPNVPAIDFDYVKIGTDRYLRVGTHGRSIYQTLLPNYCLPEGITFSTQVEIDSFQTNYPGCTEIEGNIIIQGDDIVNLNGLNGVTYIGGGIDIYSNYALTNLTGLEGLTSIGDYLRIYFNDSLTSLTGLDNLTSIGGNIEVDYNNSLTSLTGLDGLISIGGDLLICGNDSLTNLTALNNLTSVGGDIVIGSIGCSNASLTNLSGLEGLISIGGGLGISTNPILTSLTDLGNLTSIGDYLYINANDSLTSLTGLDNLTSIGGNLSISFNDALTNITGLDNIYAGSIIDLGIWGNTLLSTCEVKSICDYLAAPNGIVQIEDNAPGCNSQSQVEAACELVSVESIDAEENYFLFPNPANQTVVITSKSGTLIENVIIYNQTGQRVYCGIPENNTLDISKLQPGMYVVEVVSNVGKEIKKLIIK